MQLRVGVSPALEYLLQRYREGYFEELVDLYIGKYKENMIFAASDDSESYNNIPKGYKYYGTFRLYEANESDFNMEAYLPTSDQLELVDFVFTTNHATINILRRFVLKTGVADVTKMFFFDNMLLTFSLLVVSWVATMAAFKLVNLDVKGTCHNFKEKIGRNEQNPDETSLFYHFGFMLLQGLPSLVTRTSPRLVSIAFQFFAMIVICTIYANIKTQLMTVENKVISNLNDLVKDNPDVTLIFFARDSLCNYLKSSSHGTYQKFWKRINTPPNMYIMTESDFHLGIVKLRESENYAFLVDAETSFVVLEIVKEIRTDEKYFMGREELPRIFALSYRKDLDPEVKRYLHRRLSRLVETGLMLSLHIKMLGVNVSPQRILRDLSDAVNLDAEEALALKHFSMTFFIWMGGLGIPVLCFLAELIAYARFSCLPRLSA